VERVPARIDRFLIERPLGTGAMGSVFLAQHPAGHKVAIKVLHDRDPSVVARFRREAELMARIRSPGVVGVFEAGVHEGQTFLVMEHVPGRDLAALLKERGALAPQAAAELLAQVARGVAAANEAGVVHRDLKPANVLLDEAGRPKVTDFGISSGALPGARSLTVTGAILGTPAYMAPEQVRDARSADARSDVYSLGVILHECLSGQPAFSGATGLAILDAVTSGRVAPLPSGTPQELVEVVKTAMAQDPNDRYTSAEFLAEALEEFAQGSEGFGRGALPLVFGLVALLAGGAGAVALATWGGVEPSPAPTPAPLESTPAPSRASQPSPSPSEALEGLARFGGPRGQAFYRERLRCWVAPVEVLREGVAAGSPAAITRLGSNGLAGLKGSPSREEGIRLLRRAAEMGDPEAMFVLSKALGSGGKGWLRKAAENRFPTAMLSLADEYGGREAIMAEASRDAADGDPCAHAFLVTHTLSSGDRDEALRRLDAALEFGLKSVTIMRGRILRSASQPNLKRSLADFVAAAADGFPEGKCGLARAYALGRGVPQDRSYARALVNEVKASGHLGLAQIEDFFLFERPADRFTFVRGLHKSGAPAYVYGEVALHLARVDPRPESFLYVAELLTRAKPMQSLDGRVPAKLGLLIIQGVAPESEWTAAQLFERSVELGDLEGRRALANCYFMGRGGVALDPAKGFALLRQAAEGGDLEAWSSLGQAYLGRIGDLEPDPDQALPCLLGAAEGGLVDAMLEVSDLYHARGQEPEARRWTIEGAARYAGEPPGEFDYARALNYLAQDAVTKGRRSGALRWAERGAAVGLPRALSLWARLAQSGKKPDWGKIAARYQEAAEEGDAEGKLGYSRCLLLGRGVPADSLAAAKLRDETRQEFPHQTRIEDLYAGLVADDLKSALLHLRFLLELEEQDLPAHCWGDLGLLMLERRADFPQPEHVFRATGRLLSRASPKLSLDPRVVFHTAGHLEAGHIPLERDAQRKFLIAMLYRRAVVQGHLGAHLAYGRCLLGGYGIPQNESEGIRVLEIAAEGGAVAAWELLGDAVRHGEVGTAEQRAAAEDLYRKGAAKGSGRCFVKLADVLFLRGAAVEGTEWAKRASEAGEIEGKILYAESLLLGRGLSPDPKRAVELLEGYAKEHRLACRVLAVAYRRGSGVEQDADAAELWEQRAAAFRR
jgi:TPR repeat protein